MSFQLYCLVKTKQRAFALYQKPRAKEQGTLADVGKMNKILIIILFDTGTSYDSFILSVCVDTLELDVERFSQDSKVSTPVGKSTTVTYVS